MNTTEKSLLEQHVGTLMQVAVIGLLGWSLMTTQQMTSDMAVLQVKVEALSVTLSQGTNDRYRGTDAARDFAAVRTEMGYLDKRINKLEAETGK